MISHGPKHGGRHQKKFSRRLRTKVTVSLLEVVLGLLQPLHPVLDLQVCLRDMSHVTCHIEHVLGHVMHCSVHDVGQIK